MFRLVAFTSELLVAGGMECLILLPVASLSFDLLSGLCPNFSIGEGMIRLVSDSYWLRVRSLHLPSHEQHEDSSPLFVERIG